MKLVRRRRRRYRHNPITWPAAIVMGPVMVAYSAWLLNKYKSCDDGIKVGEVCIEQSYRWFLWTGLVLGGVATTAAIIHYAR